MFEEEEIPTGPKSMQFSFTPEKIMMQMNKKLLKRLRSFWENIETMKEQKYQEQLENKELNECVKLEKGLNIIEFAELIMSRIHTNNDDEKYELIHGCYKLFQQIDINGDETLEWGEFLQYIVDAVSGNAIKAGEGQDPVRE